MFIPDIMQVLKYTDKQCRTERDIVLQNTYFKLVYGFFNFGYYLCVIPFRFYVNKEENKVTLKTSAWKKLTVLLSWMLSLAYHYFRQRSIILKDSWHSNVLICFNILHGLMHALTFSLFYFEAFTRHKQYLEMILAIKNCKLLMKRSNTSEGQWTNFTLLIILSVIMIGMPLLGLFVYLEDNDWDFQKTYKWSCAEGKKYSMIFWDKTALTCKPISNVFDVSIPEIFTSLIPSLLSLSYSFLAATRILSFIHPAMTMFAGVQAFLQKVMRKDKCDLQTQVVHTRRAHLYNNYAQLKMLNQSLNEVWSLSYFLVLIDHVLWLATDLNTGMKEKGFIRKIVVVFYFSGVVVLSVVASEVSRKMCVFKVWLSENWSEIFVDFHEYTNFRESLEDNGIWIGKTGLYKLNYNFMGQVVVLVITLFIIALQSERTSG